VYHGSYFNPYGITPKIFSSRLEHYLMELQQKLVMFFESPKLAVSCV
jgi:hypothetical protein